MHMVYDGIHAIGGMHWIGWIFSLALISVIVFYLWRRPSDRRHDSRETPHVALKRRLAIGEISYEEYEQRKQLLDRDVGAKS